MPPVARAALVLPILLVACRVSTEADAPDAGAPRTKLVKAEVPAGKPRRGTASFYGREFAGRETASGETFRTEAMTAASRTLPLGTRVRVTNTETGQSARLTINDRGPYVKGRMIDVTPKAARRIGLAKEDGLAKVAVQPLKTKTVAVAAP